MWLGLYWDQQLPNPPAEDTTARVTTQVSIETVWSFRIVRCLRKTLVRILHSNPKHELSATDILLRNFLARVTCKNCTGGLVLLVPSSFCLSQAASDRCPPCSKQFVACTCRSSATSSCSQTRKGAALLETAITQSTVAAQFSFSLFRSQERRYLTYFISEK